MFSALFLLVAASPVELRPSPKSFDFSRSFIVSIVYREERCRFFMTDVGEDETQLTETLRRYYDAAAGIEILTVRATPSHCVAKAKKAVRRAGFVHFRVRLGTDADRSPGIP